MLRAAAPPALMIARASATTRLLVSARRRFSSPPGGLNHSVPALWPAACRWLSIPAPLTRLTVNVVHYIVNSVARN